MNRSHLMDSIETPKKNKLLFFIREKNSFDYKRFMEELNPSQCFVKMDSSSQEESDVFIFCSVYREGVIFDTVDNLIKQCGGTCVGPRKKRVKSRAQAEELAIFCTSTLNPMTVFEIKKRHSLQVGEKKYERLNIDKKKIHEYFPNKKNG